MVNRPGNPTSAPTQQGSRRDGKGRGCGSPGDRGRCGCSSKLSNGIKAESIPADHPDYAVIYFYRTSNFAATPNDVHLGNDVVYRSKNNTKAAVKVDKPGTYEIWGKTETREGITLNIEMGKEYYVRTYVKFGVEFNPLTLTS